MIILKVISFRNWQNGKKNLETQQTSSLAKLIFKQQGLPLLSELNYFEHVQNVIDSDGAQQNCVHGNFFLAEIGHLFRPLKLM